MKIVFFGTPDYVIPVLDALKNANHEIIAVVTQPDKPVGRKQILNPSPVAQWAGKHGIRVIDNSPKEIIPLLTHITRPTSHNSFPTLAILAAYGKIIPQEIIDILPKGILNIHPSLLPKYRGATPVEAAIVAGEKQTGVTIIKLDAQMDHGPILAQATEDISPDDTRATLRERLFQKGAQILIEILPAYFEGRVELREQDHKKATFTKLLKKEHGFIPGKFIDGVLRGETLNEEWQIPFVKDLTIRQSPITIHNFIRAMHPWPGAWTWVRLRMTDSSEQKRLKILKAHVEQVPASHPQNSTHFPLPTLVLDLVQLEGKTPVSWKEFKRGYPEASF